MCVSCHGMRGVSRRLCWFETLRCWRKRCRKPSEDNTSPVINSLEVGDSGVVVVLSSEEPAVLAVRNT